MAIEVFCRQCLFSSISQHKKRLPFFSHERCYRNLIRTIDRDQANLTFFLDRAGRDPKDHFIQEPVIAIDEGTEAGSFLRLIEYVTALPLDPETIVYFVEDDYLHRPGWVGVLLEAFTIPGVDYVTLYDHRDKYFDPSYRYLRSELYVTPSCHWRTIPSTTQTFAMRQKTLIRDFAVHRRYSEGRKVSADHEKFCSLTRRGVKLISSIPGWSTHAEPAFASPCIDWEGY